MPPHTGQSNSRGWVLTWISKDSSCVTGQQHNDNEVKHHGMERTPEAGIKGTRRSKPVRHLAQAQVPQGLEGYFRIHYKHRLLWSHNASVRGLYFGYHGSKLQLLNTHGNE